MNPIIATLLALPVIGVSVALVVAVCPRAEHKPHDDNGCSLLCALFLMYLGLMWLAHTTR